MKHITEMNLQEENMRKIVYGEYIPNYVPVDNIMPQIDQIVNDILDKKKLILRMKNMYGENGILFEKERKNMSNEIVQDMIKIINLQNNQKNIIFSKLGKDEKFATTIRMLKMVKVIKNLEDVIPGYVVNPECIIKFNEMGVTL